MFSKDFISIIELQTSELEKGKYQRFKFYNQTEEEKSKLFNMYLREQGKIIINLDSLISCEKYKLCFFKTYFGLLCKDPNKFVLYNPACNWSTLNGELQTWQIRTQKGNISLYFPCYFKALFTDASTTKCNICTNIGICLYCESCSVGFCTTCFVQLRDALVKYNNWFKCPCCKQICII